MPEVGEATHITNSDGSTSVQIKGSTAKRHVGTYQDFVLAWTSLLGHLASQAPADVASASAHYAGIVTAIAEEGDMRVWVPMYMWDEWVREQVWLGAIPWD